MLKNVAGQSIGVQMTVVASGLPFTGAVTIYVTGDRGTQVIGSEGSGLCAHEGNGFHSYAPAQAETNFDHIAWTFLGAGAITVTVQLYTESVTDLSTIMGPGFSASTDTLEAIRDAITASLTALLGNLQAEIGTIVGFPTELHIGDSYTDDAGQAIIVYVRDTLGTPISTFGTHAMTDLDFAPELVITQGGQTGRVRATVTYVDPGAPESYLLVEIPASESRRAGPGAATMQCVLKWTTSGAQQTLATQNVTWLPLI